MMKCYVPVLPQNCHEILQLFSQYLEEFQMDSGLTMFKSEIIGMDIESGTC